MGITSAHSIVGPCHESMSVATQKGTIVTQLITGHYTHTDTCACRLCNYCTIVISHVVEGRRERER